MGNDFGDVEMKKKIAEIYYEGKQKTLWAVPLQDGKNILLYFKEYDCIWASENKDFFFIVGWQMKFKPSYRFASSYTIWFKGNVEDCLIHLVELDKKDDWRITMNNFTSLDEIQSIGILDLLGD